VNEREQENIDCFNSNPDYGNCNNFVDNDKQFYNDVEKKVDQNTISNRMGEGEKKLTGIAKILSDKSHPINTSTSSLNQIAVGKKQQRNIHYCVSFNKEIIDFVEELKFDESSNEHGYLFHSKDDYNRALKSLLKKKNNVN